MTKKISAWRVFLAVVISFYAVSLLMKPGVVDLTTPSHSDLYRYFLIAEHRWTLGDWLSPRPLMLVFLKIAGFSGSPWVLYFLIALPSFLFLAGALLLLHRLKVLYADLPTVLVFCTLAIGSPWFYPLFQYDYGGMLSGAFFVGAMYFLYRYLDDSRAASGGALIIFVLVTWISIETKPAFPFALLFFLLLPATGLARTSQVLTSRSRVAGACVLGLMSFVFVKDKMLGSAFIELGSNSSPYGLVLDPSKNLSAIAFYARKSFSPALGVLVVISIWVMYSLGKMRIAAGVALCAVGAMFPMALIPNRQWEVYAWYATAMWCILVAIAFSSVRYPGTSFFAKRTSLGITWGGMFSLGFCVFSLIYAFSGSPVVEWTYAQHAYNKRVLGLLSVEDRRHAGRFLVAGVAGPYHPFRNTEFVNKVFPRFGTYDLLLLKSEKEWNEMSHELSNGKYLQDVRFEDYDFIYRVSKDGSKARIIPGRDLLAVPEPARSGVLFCGIDDLNAPSDLAGAIDCLNGVGEYSAAIELGERYRELGERQPWIYYHLALAYGAVGNLEKKRGYAALALSVEPENRRFLEFSKE